MSHLIHVRPTPEQRRAFAVWATRQTPKVRTVAPDTFAVPAGLFTEIPEEVMIGSVVDGHRYVSPYDEGEGGVPTALVGEHGPEVLVPMREAAPGDRLPDAPEATYGPDSVPLSPPDFSPLEDAPADDQGAPGGDGAEGTAEAGPVPAGTPDEDQAAPSHPCGSCERTYATERGLLKHRRRVHAEGA